MGHNVLHLGKEIQPSTQLDPRFEVRLEFDLRLTRGWLTRLSCANQDDNRLNLNYFRDYQKPVRLVEGIVGIKKYRIEDGVFEAEFADSMKAHRVVFQVKDGFLVWIHSMTLSKTRALEKVTEALSSSRAR
jgi:hypothetical protein